jgi:serine/threonine protein kinase
MPPISPERWRILSPYLDEALEIPTQERAAWLAAIDASDPSIVVDLKAMLAEHLVVHDSHFMERSVLEEGSGLGESLAGQTVGAYRIVSFIGQGGSGSVWLAERCDGRFQGRAAVKLLNLSLLGPSGEERFRREGTILARLRHPRIAHLIDAGVSPAGQPYLILEYVDGRPIDRFCDDRNLGVEARIRLFLEVLDAVAHAHGNLIVHRDLKPANVLVSADGEVKLLDFGIAKLIEGDFDFSEQPRKTPRTREGGGGLTPEFAAPEQLSGGEVSTATDVFALGVLLYVLLTGQHPAGSSVGSPAALVRAVIETDPPRPSDAAGAVEHDQDAAAHARHCGTTPARLRRTLRGDLDTIVAKALKKNAWERYASVSAFADDLRRYLRHEPISARPDTVRYRTARFVRRHAGAVTAAAAVVLLIAGLTVVHTTRLSAERDYAQREAARAARVSEALTRLLTSADPIASRPTPGGLTVRGMLDAGSAQIQKELAGQPEAQAEIFTVLGRIYRRLGIFDKAEQLLEQALISGQQVYGHEHVRVAQTLNDLGALQTETGDYAAAERNLAQALEMRRRLLGSEHADVAVTLVELGRVYEDLGNSRRAEPLMRESLAIRRRVLGESHPETPVSVAAVASVLRLSGDLAGAESLLQGALELNRRTRGETHPNTATTFHDLALIAAARKDYRAAETHFRDALARYRDTLGESHPGVAVTLNGLARTLSEQGRLDEASAAARDLLGMARTFLGGEHQLLAIYSLNAGALHLARREPALAEPLVREGLRIRALNPALVPSRRRFSPEDDWSVGAAKSLLGATLTALARYEEAEAILLDARRELEFPSPSRAADLELTNRRLAQLYTVWRKR